MEELKPCPFCGSSNVTMHELNPNSYARCRGCGAEGGLRDSHDKAADAWNRRADAKKLVVRLDVSDEQVRRMVDEAVRAAIDDCMEQIRKAVGHDTRD